MFFWGIRFFFYKKKKTDLRVRDIFKGRRPTQKTTHPNKNTVCANSSASFLLVLKGKGVTVCTNCPEIVCANCVFIWVGGFLGGSPSLQPVRDISTFFAQKRFSGPSWGSEDVMGGWKKEGGGNLTNDTPPKKGFWTPPRTIRFPPPSGVSALFFLYNNP